MAVINQVMVEVYHLVARQGGPNTPTSTSIAGSHDSSSQSATVTSPTPTATSSNSSGPTSSPLLFFVALGFGVVFTNLWIIVGVKYCFRYNARNRAMRAGEDGEPINLENMPTRPHRRRREKKLMSMEEVNERFPLTKYKAWVASRAREGLPTAGGVTAPPSRAGSVREAEDIEPASPTGTKNSEARPDTAASEDKTNEIAISPPTNTLGGEFGSEKPKGPEPTVQEVAALHEEENSSLEPIHTVASTVGKHPVVVDEEEQEEDEEDDHIHTAVPPELLTNPGDSCAICIDTLEEDDDIRGLTCGHAFHAGCLDPWLTSRRACCPLCKADYYTPKPRPEGEAANAERPNRRSHAARANLPQPPTSTWARGNSRFLPGRFGNPSRHETATRRDTRRRRPRYASDGILDANIEISNTGPRLNGNPAESSVWRPRMPNRPSWLRLPGRNRTATNEQEAEANPSPSQLEAGVVR